METPQNVTNENKLTDDKRQKLALLHEQYISFVAVGGLLTDDDGTLKKKSISEFAAELGVDRRTLSRWKDSLPNFWERVEKRRDEIFTKNRITAVWNGLFLRAAKGDAQQAIIILSQYAKWQPPAQKKPEAAETNSWAALVDKKRQQQNYIEGEVLNNDAAN